MSSLAVTMKGEVTLERELLQHLGADRVRQDAGGRDPDQGGAAERVNQ